MLNKEKYAKEIAEIVSSDSELRIETYITNKDIARIEKRTKGCNKARSI